jgi:hypothetical protein
MIPAAVLDATSLRRTLIQPFAIQQEKLSIYDSALFATINHAFSRIGPSYHPAWQQPFLWNVNLFLALHAIIRASGFLFY